LNLIVEDLDDALSRVCRRLDSRALAVVANEAVIDYRHFRLNGTRDYGLPPEKCVDIEPDGVTLTVDPERSDLLVETELLALPDASTIRRTAVDDSIE